LSLDYQNQTRAFHMGAGRPEQSGPGRPSIPCSEAGKLPLLGGDEDGPKGTLGWEGVAG